MFCTCMIIILKLLVFLLKYAIFHQWMLKFELLDINVQTMNIEYSMLINLA
jgi:hypothetical protein